MNGVIKSLSMDDHGIKMHVLISLCLIFIWGHVRLLVTGVLSQLLLAFGILCGFLLFLRPLAHLVYDRML